MKERSVIMMEFMFGWLIGKNLDNKNQEQKIQNYEPTKLSHKKEEITMYEYWPAFDNDIPSLELAYQLYEENNVCHILKNGTCKCYLEFMGGDDYITTKQENFFERI